MAQISEVIEGLQILSRYPLANDVSAGNEAIYAGPSEDDAKYDEDDNLVLGSTVVSVEDAKRLLLLGWHLDTEFSCWAHFV